MPWGIARHCPLTAPSIMSTAPLHSMNAFSAAFLSSDARITALRRWVRQEQRDAGHRPGLTTSERERLKELEREVRELKRANETLVRVGVFAQAELDRRGK